MRDTVLAVAVVTLLVVVLVVFVPWIDPLLNLLPAWSPFRLTGRYWDWCHDFQNRRGWLR